MKNRLLFFTLIFYIIIFPVSINAQKDGTNFEDIQNDLRIMEDQNTKRNEEIIQKIVDIKESSDNLTNELFSMQSEITKTNNNLQDILNKINTQLQKNQIQDEKAQLMYTLAQISGVFVAIMGGFFTTKVLSLSTEKNRITRRIKEIDSELDNKKSIIEHYQNIVDNIGKRWARREINEFRNHILSDSYLKEYSKNELIKKFTAYNRNTPDEYEKKLLEEEYNDILKKIKEKLEEKRKQIENDARNILSPFSISMPDLSHLTLSSFALPQNERNVIRFQESSEKLKLEQAEDTHLKTEKDNLNKELEDIATPKSVVRGILFSFFAIISGVIIPLYFPLTNNVTQTTTMFGFVGFMISLMLMYYYFGFELQSIIEKPNKQSILKKLWKVIRKKQKSIHQS